MQRGGAILLALLAAGGSACTKRVDDAGTAESKGGSSSAPSIDVAADRAVAKGSWLVALGRDSAPLTTLARSSAGWPAFFKGDLVGAAAAFRADAKGDNLDAKVGLARAALALAEAEAALGRTQLALTQNWLKAQATRPDNARTAPWRAIVEARLLTRTGGDATAALRSVGTEGEAAALAAILADPKADTHELLHGRAAKDPGASWPGGVGDGLQARLAALAALHEGNLSGAIKLLEGVAPEAPDFVAGAEAAEGKVALRDPWVAGFAALIWARQAEVALKDVAGWPSLLRAQALALLDRRAEAIALLEPLTKTPPTEAAPLSQMVLSGSLDAKDLLAEAQAHLVANLVAAGRAADATPVLAAMTEDTITRRVWRAWARAELGEALDRTAFPEDRDVLGHAIDAELQALGAKSPGMADVTALLLVERTVDAVQRAFAATARRGGDGALAVKHREASEDKLAAMAPSARNTLPALAAAADDNVAIGRPRVALKYYSRMRERLPAVVAPSEMLRDLLSLQAMEHDGSTTAGQ